MSTQEGQKRARPGGEVGANGEFYEGGKFIATTDHAKGKKRAGKGSGRVEVENYTWVPSRDGFRPLYGRLAGIEVRDRATGRFSFNEGLRGDDATAGAITQRRADIAAWNEGKRWVSTAGGYE